MGSNPGNSYKLYVGNLSPSTTKEDLHEVFSEYGQVVEAVVMTGKNFGFVHMQNENDGKEAQYYLHGQILKGREMVVKASINPKKPSIHPRQTLVGRGVANLDDFVDFNKESGQSNSGSQSDLSKRSSDAHSSPTPSPLHSSSGRPSPLLGGPPTPKSQDSGSSVGLPLHHTINGYLQEIIKPQSMEDKTSYCGICEEKFDKGQRVPKILDCNHSFCCDCLSSITSNGLIKCPYGPKCQIITQIGFGIAGLPTNYDSLCHLNESKEQLLGAFNGGSTSSISSGAVSVDGFYKETLQHQRTDIPTPPTSSYQNNSLFHRNNISQACSMNSGVYDTNVLNNQVCCTCLKYPPGIECSEEGHNIQNEDEAHRLLHTRLIHEFDMCLSDLRSAMTKRASIKERMESTIHSLNRFSEELRRKVEGEELEEAMLESTLTDIDDLRRTYQNNPSIYQAILGNQKMISYSQSIATQYNQALTTTALNNATNEIVLRLKAAYGPRGSYSYLGLQDEMSFPMSSSLEDHARSGNFANVLLTYMISDLLTARLNHSTDASVENHSRDGIDSGVSSIYGNEDGSQTSSFESMSINTLLQTTEAIENGAMPNRSGIRRSEEELSHPASVLSLGLNSLLLLGSNEVTSDSSMSKVSSRQLTNGYEGESSVVKPFSYVDAAKRPAKAPVPEATTSKVALPSQGTSLLASSVSKASGKFPHCWMKLSVDGVIEGRIIFELRPDKAPRMCENFVGLCTGKAGYGYKGTHFFKGGEGFLSGGDIENDDGSGGYSMFDMKKFEADLCPLKDDVGMIRFKGTGTSENGRGMVGSQFMVWYAEREFKKFSFSLVFGRVVDGISLIQEVASLNLQKVAVKIEECGAI